MAGKPDTPHNCSLSKLSDSSYQVNCESGFDGGLPQEFICEVHKNGTDRAVWNITNLRSPDFTITAIEHDIEYVIKIYSSNGKGRSPSYVELRIVPSYEMFEQHTRTVGKVYLRIISNHLCERTRVLVDCNGFFPCCRTENEIILFAVDAYVMRCVDIFNMFSNSFNN